MSLGRPVNKRTVSTLKRISGIVQLNLRCETSKLHSAGFEALDGFEYSGW